MALMVSLPSRGLNGYAGAVLAGGVSAALFAVALMRADTLFVMLAYFSAFPLFVAGLGAGITSAVIASVIGIAGLCATKPFDFAMFYAAVYGVPTVILAALALRQEKDKEGKPVWYSEGNLLTAITLYPCVAFLAAIAAASGHDGGLLGMTKQMLTASTVQFKDALDPETYARFTSALDQMARFMPALLGCSWMLIMLLSMLAAQSVLKQKNWNLRPGFTIQDVFIPSWLVFAAAATGLAGAFAPEPLYKYVGANLCAMLCIPFVFTGLAVVHFLAGLTKAKTVLLVIFYLVLSVVIWMFLFVAALGVIDQWVDFRHRFAANSKKGG